MKKKELPASKAAISLKCGDCLHFQKNAKFEKPCSQLGVKHFAIAPQCYSPNVYQLTKQNPDVLFQIGLLFKDFSAQDARILMAVLKQSTSFEKHYKLKFGQPVFFRVGNSDYLSNYFMGYVIGVSEAGENQVFVTSDMHTEQRAQPLVGSFLRENLMTVTEFKKKKEALSKAGRMQDPKPVFNMRASKRMAVDDSYVPPTMDHAPKEWLDKTTYKQSKKKVKRELDGTLTFKIGG